MMEENLKSGKDLSLDWKSLSEVWELRNHESKFYLVNEVTNCIEIDPNHLLSSSTADHQPKDKVEQFNQFMIECKSLYKKLLLDANTSFETNQLLIPMKTVQRINIKQLKKEKTYRCPFSGEQTDQAVQLFYQTTTEKEYQKSATVPLCSCMIVWLEAMYVLKYITDNLVKNSENAIKFAWETIHPLPS